MKIPWIEAWNEHRRRKAEARKESREVERMVNAYEGMEKSFSQAFGLPFELAVRAAILPHMRTLVRESLPDILASLADGDPAVDSTGTDPGNLVATLSRSTGAYWGPAPEGDGGRDNAFHVAMSYDEDHDRYTFDYNGGTVTFFASNSATLAGGTATSTGSNLFAYLFYDPPSGNTPGTWSLEVDQANAYPTPSDGEIVVPLWHFAYAADGAGELTRETEGLVFIPAIRNVVDTDA